MSTATTHKILAPHEIRERLQTMKTKLDFLRGSL